MADTLLSVLPSELSRIEQAVIAGRIDASAAIQATVQAIGSLDTVKGVDVVLTRAGRFLSVASQGSHPDAPNEFYAECFANGRLLRCDDATKDARAEGLDFVSAMLLPLSSRGSVIGVLAVFSRQAQAFGHEHIVPLSTAATICSVLAPQILEAGAGSHASSSAKARPNSKSARPNGKTSAPSPSPDSHQASQDEAKVPPTARVAAEAPAVEPPSEIRPSPTKLELRGSARVPAERNVRHHAEHVARENALRSLVVARPAEPVAEIPRPPSSGSLAWRFVRRPFVLAPLVLLFSGMVFGSMQMLRSAKAAPSSVSKTRDTGSLSFTVTKSVGTATAMPGMRVPAETPISPGRLTQDYQPTYPPEALQRAVEGKVTAVLVVSDRGAVEDVRITEGDPQLANSVVAALSHWRFSPFEIHDRAVPVEVPVTITFHIAQETIPARK